MQQSAEKYLKQRMIKLSLPKNRSFVHKPSPGEKPKEKPGEKSEEKLPALYGRAFANAKRPESQVSLVEGAKRFSEKPVLAKVEDYND